MSWSQFITLHWEVVKVSGFFATPWSRVRRSWAEMTRIGCNLSAQGRQRLGLVFYNTLSVLTRVAQQWHTLWSRYLLPCDAQYHLIVSRRRVSEGSFQSVTPQVKACLVEQDRSPPGARQALIRPDGDLHCRRGATDSRFVTVSNTEHERRQRCDHRHLKTAEDGVYPVAARPTLVFHHPRGNSCCVRSPLRSAMNPDVNSTLGLSLWGRHGASG